MSGFGGPSNDEVTLQPGPSSSQIYWCPTCERFDWSPFPPMCDGTTASPHKVAQAQLVSTQWASRIDPSDPPNFY